MTPLQSVCIRFETISGLLRPDVRHLHEAVEVSAAASGHPRFEIRPQEMADRRNRIENRTALLSLLVRLLLLSFLVRKLLPSLNYNSVLALLVLRVFSSATVKKTFFQVIEINREWPTFLQISAKISIKNIVVPKNLNFLHYTYLARSFNSCFTWNQVPSLWFFVSN